MINYLVQTIKIFGPSLHQIMGKTYSLELQVECQNSSGKSIVIMVLFKIDPKGETTSHFLKEIGIGNGKIKKMGINKEQTVTFLCLKVTVLSLIHI